MDSASEPLLEANKGDGRKKLSRFAQAFAPVSSARSDGENEQPWASLSATYCPPDLSVKTAPAPPASKQRKPVTVPALQTDLPVSRGAHHSDESPRAALTPPTPFQAPAARANHFQAPAARDDRDQHAASTSMPASSLQAAAHKHNPSRHSHFAVAPHLEPRQQRASFQMQPDAERGRHHHSAATSQPEARHQPKHFSHQQPQVSRAADFAQGNVPSSSRSQSGEDQITVMASRTGDGSKYRRTVSISPRSSPHSSERSLQGLGSGDIASRASQLGLARASELAWRLDPRAQSERQPSAISIPLLNAQPSLASTISARQADLLRQPSLLDPYAHPYAPEEASPHGPSPMWTRYDSGLVSSSNGALASAAPAKNHAQQAMHNQLVPFHSMHSPHFMHSSSDLAAYHGAKIPFAAQHPYPQHLQHHHSSGVDRVHDAVLLWRAAVKWVVLWLTLSVLTVMNSIALVLILDSNVFALICAIMFCWSGVMGIYGATRTLMGHCMARDDDHTATLEGYNLRPVEVLGFTTAALSGLAAVAHFVSEQIITRDMHLPACAPGDTQCIELYNMIVIMMVASTVLYGCHAVVSSVITFKAYNVRSMAASNAYLFSP
ncbi:hypothetical protein WJX73_008144 [Symbiochloris irregularis]|uniref:Uncharacterized protein n=1 Tax=Symbiochloris irregularis TaxID=706552 RepID=A0AAW1PTR1_9CHLO